MKLTLIFLSNSRNESKLAYYPTCWTIALMLREQKKSVETIYINVGWDGGGVLNFHTHKAVCAVWVWCSWKYAIMLDKNAQSNLRQHLVLWVRPCLFTVPFLNYENKDERQTSSPGIVSVMLRLLTIKSNACKFVWCVYFTHLPALRIPSKVSRQERYQFLPHRQAAFSSRGCFGNTERRGERERSGKEN